jgi:hypothetical protein
MEADVHSLESVWEQREEEIYPSLFGPVSRGMFPLGAESFVSLGQEEVDPRWLHLGVFEFALTEQRNSWLYVTSGGSTPWETEPAEFNPDEYSWLGVEFVVEAPERAEWPIRLLHRVLAYHLLLCMGKLDGTPVDYGHRLPTGPVDGALATQIRAVAVAKPDHYPAQQQLPSGKFDFLHLVGITESERDWARAHSTAELVEILASAGAFPVTVPTRASAV